jgi:phage host-nuclease inhibitor protein Gam
MNTFSSSDNNTENNIISSDSNKDIDVIKPIEVQKYFNDFDSIEEASPVLNIVNEINNSIDNIDDDISVLTADNIMNDNINYNVNDDFKITDVALIKQISTEIGSYIIDSEVQKYWAEKRKQLTTPERQKSMDLVEGIISKKLRDIMATIDDDYKSNNSN